MSAVSVDIGSNISNLLEKLAVTIGTTVNDLYPYYVTKVKTEALANMLALGIADFFGLIVVIIGVVLYMKYYDTCGKWYDIGVISAVIGSVFLFFAVFFSFVTLPSLYTQYINPVPYAISDMAKSVQKINCSK